MQYFINNRNIILVTDGEIGPDECHWTLLITSQHGFRQFLMSSGNKPLTGSMMTQIYAIWCYKATVYWHDVAHITAIGAVKHRADIGLTRDSPYTCLTGEPWIVYVVCCGEIWSRYNWIALGLFCIHVIMSAKWSVNIPFSRYGKVNSLTLFGKSDC